MNNDRRRHGDILNGGVTRVKLTRLFYEKRVSCSVHGVIFTQAEQRLQMWACTVIFSFHWKSDHSRFESNTNAMKLDISQNI